MSEIKCALLSVTDKTGIVDLACALAEIGAEIISTGGTARSLREAEVTVKEVSEVTGFPEILEGRVKTLHPKIFGGILALPKESHVSTLQAHDIPKIGMVVVNLYPFEKIQEEGKLSGEELLEYIDIGGVSLLRAASKNYSNVVTLCDPKDYRQVIEELKNKGTVSKNTRAKLAAKAFAHTSHYDAVIAAVLRQASGTSTGASEDFPRELTLPLKKLTDLRYGENPHQRAALYAESGSPFWGIASARVTQGKATSFNNYLDCDAAWKIVLPFTGPACAIIKHNNPCGVAEAETITDAYRRAYSCDPQSAFGGIVGVNRTVDAELARELVKVFLECVVAPGYHPEAKEILASKPNLRLLEQPAILAAPYEKDFRRISGGFLVQDLDYNPKQEFTTVTKRKPTPEEMAALEFAWNVGSYVKSNAIVLVRGRQTIGIGAGQMSRIDSLKIAAMKMAQVTLTSTQGSWPLVMSSDGFFPFRDSVDEAAKIGVTAIIQPGGSVRDKEVIGAANEHGLAMVLTGVRHFRH